MKIVRGRTFSHRNGQKELELFELVRILSDCKTHLRACFSENGEDPKNDVLYCDLVAMLKRYNKC